MYIWDKSDPDFRLTGYDLMSYNMMLSIAFLSNRFQVISNLIHLMA